MVLKKAYVLIGPGSEVTSVFIVGNIYSKNIEQSEKSLNRSKQKNIPKLITF